MTHHFYHKHVTLCKYRDSLYSCAHSYLMVNPLFHFSSPLFSQLSPSSFAFVFFVPSLPKVCVSSYVSKLFYFYFFQEGFSDSATLSKVGPGWIHQLVYFSILVWSLEDPIFVSYVNQNFFLKTHYALKYCQMRILNVDILPLTTTLNAKSNFWDMN